MAAPPTVCAGVAPARLVAVATARPKGRSVAQQRLRLLTEQLEHVATASVRGAERRIAHRLLRRRAWRARCFRLLLLLLPLPLALLLPRRPPLLLLLVLFELELESRGHLLRCR